MLTRPGSLWHSMIYPNHLEWRLYEFCVSQWIFIQINNFFNLPVPGIEPLTLGLQGQCSTPTPQGLTCQLPLKVELSKYIIILWSYLICFSEMNWKTPMNAGTRVKILKTDIGPTKYLRTSSVYKSCQKSSKLKKRKEMTVNYVLYEIIFKIFFSIFLLLGFYRVQGIIFHVGGEKTVLTKLCLMAHAHCLRLK